MKFAALLVTLFALTPLAASAPDLRITAALEKPEVAFEEAVVITVTFENRGDTEVTYFEPLFAGMIFFPSIRLVHAADGRVYAPWVSPFQSMVDEGIQGALIRLGAGEKHVYRHAMARFRRDGEGDRDWKENQALPAGSYRVLVTYDRPDDQVPFNTGGFDEEPRRVPGLFVGSLKSEALQLTVADPTKPRLLLDMPEQGPAVLRVTVENPSREQLVLTGFPRLTVHSKMYGSGIARPNLPGPGDGSADRPVVITVPAGGTSAFEVNLRALTFLCGDRGACGLGEFIPSGTVHLGLDILDGAGGCLFSAGGIFASIRAPESRGLENLAVRCALSESEIGAGAPVKLTILLSNDGEADLGVVSALRFPRSVTIRVDDATGKRPSIFAVTMSGGRPATEFFRPGEEYSRLAKGMTFDGDRFEETVGLRPAELKRLAPGETLTREFALDTLLSGGFVPGTYRVSVGYRNFEPGLRFGLLEADLLGVGIVWSEPISLVVR
jgi:hypothetical protein